MAGFNMKVLFVGGSMRREMCSEHHTRMRGKKGSPRLQHRSRKVSYRPIGVFTPVRKVLHVLRQERALLIYELKAEYGKPGLSMNMMVDPEGSYLAGVVNYAPCKRRSQ